MREGGGGLGAVVCFDLCGSERVVKRCRKGGEGVVEGWRRGRKGPRVLGGEAAGSVTHTTFRACCHQLMYKLWTVQ